MQVDWSTLIGLVGCTLVISGSNVLPQFRDWCGGFRSAFQPLRWIGVTLEFAGIVTDKSMATGFLIGLAWWCGHRPWSEVLVLSGQLTVLAALADGFFALMQAMLQKVVGLGGPVAPMRIPRNRIDELESEGLSPARKPRGKVSGRPLTEREAFDALDEDDGEGDAEKGA